ncbi:MAG: hypothetical protein FVQ81_08835 [Candidatus Glassbacteria bacterium]|nr:hypothetical protein [Candidatus Glassbacteria bacterium]
MLFEQGRLKYAGRCGDGYLGLGIFETEGEEEVQRIMESDPAITAGVMSHTLRQWRTALSPQGW